MRVTKVYCDECGEEIPKVKKMDVYGNEIEIYRFGKVNYGHGDMDFRQYGIDLCEKCAMKISLEVQNKRTEALLNLKRRF